MTTMQFRNLDKDTKQFLQVYSVEHHVSMGQALGEIVQLAKEHMRNKP